MIMWICVWTTIQIHLMLRFNIHLCLVDNSCTDIQIHLMLRFNHPAQSASCRDYVIQIHLMLRFNQPVFLQCERRKKFKYISCYGLILVFPCPSQFNIPQKPLFFNKFAKIYQPVFIFSYFYMNCQKSLCLEGTEKV